MKRRLFIKTAAAAAGALTVTPAIISSCSNQQPRDPLITPALLSIFCNENIIREIGIQYRKQVPEENTKDQLTRLLLTDEKGNTLATSRKSKIAETLKKKAQQEFSEFQFIVLNGWVISKTEARQCALFSLS